MTDATNGFDWVPRPAGAVLPGTRSSWATLYAALRENPNQDVRLKFVEAKKASSAASTFKKKGLNVATIGPSRHQEDDTHHVYVKYVPEAVEAAV